MDFSIWCLIGIQPKTPCSPSPACSSSSPPHLSNSISILPVAAARKRLESYCTSHFLEHPISNLPANSVGPTFEVMWNPPIISLTAILVQVYIISSLDLCRNLTSHLSFPLSPDVYSPQPPEWSHHPRSSTLSLSHNSSNISQLFIVTLRATG